jgi:tetratricopeptide (TPR) repeat protein
MSNSTNFIHHANIRAVQLLQESRHKEAISYLRRGVKIALAQIQNTNSTNPSSLLPFAFEAQQQQSMQGNRSAPQCLDSMDMEDDGRLTYTVAIPEVQDAMSSSPENMFVVFNRAFTLYEVHGVMSSSAASTKVAATLLYNIGLAFHQMGIQENNTAALKKSLSTYQLAYKLLSEHCNDSFGCLLLLALCNNMSHIHGHFFDLEEAKSFWDLTTEILDCVSLVDSSVAIDDFAFFVAEVLLFEGRGRGFECAPAA